MVILDEEKAFDSDMSLKKIKNMVSKIDYALKQCCKMLEKYHYITFYKYCKKILEDGIVTDKETDDLDINEQLKVY